MGFMQLVTEYGIWYKVTDTHGEGTICPGDLVGASPDAEDFADYIESGEPESFERHEGWAARYSAPGYLDCTEWSGVYETEKEAREACVLMYGDDEEEEEEGK